MMKMSGKVLLFQLMVAVALVVALPMTVSAKVTYEKEQVLYMSSKNDQVPSQGTVLVQCTKESEKIKKSAMKISAPSVAELIALVGTQQKNQTQYFGNYGQNQTMRNYAYQMELKLFKPGKTKVSFKVGKKKHTIKLNVKAYTNPIKKMTISGVNGGKNIASKFTYTSQCTDFKVLKKTSKAVINITPNKNWKVENVGFMDVQNGESYAYVKNGLLNKSKVNLSVGTLRPGEIYDMSIRLRHKNGGVITCVVRLQ